MCMFIYIFIYIYIQMYGCIYICMFPMYILYSYMYTRAVDLRPLPDTVESPPAALLDPALGGSVPFHTYPFGMYIHVYMHIYRNIHICIYIYLYIYIHMGLLPPRGPLPPRLPPPNPPSWKEGAIAAKAAWEPVIVICA